MLFWSHFIMLDAILLLVYSLPLTQEALIIASNWARKEPATDVLLFSGSFYMYTVVKVMVLVRT